MSRDAVLACELVQQIAMLGVEGTALRDAFVRGTSAEIIGKRREELRLIAVGPNDGFSRFDVRENAVDGAGADAAIERRALEPCQALREIRLRVRG